MRSATDRMMREDWRLVGEALLIGRAECLSEKTGKLNNKRFGEWCQSNGFCAVDRRDRAAAVWLAEMWEAVVAIADITDHNPRHIQAAYKKATALDEQTAVKAMKFYLMADAESASCSPLPLARSASAPLKSTGRLGSSLRTCVLPLVCTSITAR